MGTGAGSRNEHIDLVIFDCDGVLVDSEVIAVEIDQRICADLGWELTTDEIVERFMGRPSSHFRSQVEQRLGITLDDGWDDQYESWYLDAFRMSLKSVAGIEQALDQIDLPTCVASSSSHEKLRMTLGHTGLLPRFEGRVYSSSEVANGKPAPDIFLHAAARMDADPTRCVVVEDSKYGVRAARAAGMHAFGYAGGLTPAAWLEDEGATVFTSMAELPALIRGHVR